MLNFQLTPAQISRRKNALPASFPKRLSPESTMMLDIAAKSMIISIGNRLLNLSTIARNRASPALGVHR
jgi:hypothetical protein